MEAAQEARSVEDIVHPALGAELIQIDVVIGLLIL